MHVAGFLRRILAAKGAFVRGGRLQRRHDAPDRILPEPGADEPDEFQMTAAMDTRHQRAEFTVGGFPAAEHHLLPVANLGLGPAFGTAGAIGCIELLGDDAFQRQFSGCLQDRVTTVLEMLDVADQPAAALPRLQ